MVNMLHQSEGTPLDQLKAELRLLDSGEFEPESKNWTLKIAYRLAGLSPSSQGKWLNQQADSGE
jgi:hypothetical protein